MKKMYLVIIMVAAFGAAFAQSVPRSMVVLEVGTGTWCTYCPGAAMGADDLLANGKLVAVVENHYNDTYANVYSNSRNSLYGVSGYPTATFDGNQAVVGGSHSNSMYPNYLPKYNSAIAVLSPVSMSMEVSNTGLDYTVTVTLTKVDNITASNLKMHFAITQSHIQQNWQGQTHLEHVNRLLVPDQNGTSISFAGGDVQVVTLNFSLPSALPLDDCEFVCWLQNHDTGQGTIAGSGNPPVKKWTTLQGIKRGVIDLTPGFSVPSTTINKGEPVTFTNETHGGYIGTPEIYQWHFPGATPATSTDENPIVTYQECGNHDVTLIVNRGGQIDTLTKTAYIQVGPNVTVSAEPGFLACWYQTITLDATTEGADSYLWMPGGMTTPTIDVTFAEYGLGDHIFTVTVNASGCEIVKEVIATLDACTGMESHQSGVGLSVYPNPGNGNFTIALSSPGPILADLSIVNSIGMTVYKKQGIAINGKILHPLQLSDLPSGIYLLTIQSGDQYTTKKLVVK